MRNRKPQGQRPRDRRKKRGTMKKEGGRYVQLVFGDWRSRRCAWRRPGARRRQGIDHSAGAARPNPRARAAGRALRQRREGIWRQAAKRKRKNRRIGAREGEVRTVGGGVAFVAAGEAASVARHQLRLGRCGPRAPVGRGNHRPLFGVLQGANSLFPHPTAAAIFAPGASGEHLGHKIHQPRLR